MKMSRSVRSSESIDRMSRSNGTSPVPTVTKIIVTRVFFFQAEDGIRDLTVTGVQTCALPISERYVAAHPGDPEGADLDAVRRFAVQELRKEQDADLQAFGVKFDVYFLESSLYGDRKSVV